VIRLITYIVLSLAISLGAAWLISLEGNLTIDFAGYRMQPSIGATILALIAIIIISILLFVIFRKIISTPKHLAKIAKEKKKDSGIKALNEGYIALLAGDGEKARKLAKQAQEKLQQNSGAKLLEARCDLLLGDMNNARENYRALISNPDTSLAALHGLFEQANAQKREDVALTFVSKAYQLDPSSAWAQSALFGAMTKTQQWQKALDVITKSSPKNTQQRQEKTRKQALLRTAIAQELENSDPNSAQNNVKLALKLLPDFVPAALIGAQIHINRNEIRKASSLLRRLFNITKHPQIAQLYIGAQSGASAIDQLKRAKELIGEKSDDAQIALVLANAAINAYEWSMARNILAPFISNPSQNICLALAQIEEGQNADEGKARNWLAKAVHAPRDFAWVGDEIISDAWEPISPISGNFDVFEWKTPPSAIVTKQFKGATASPKEQLEEKLLPSISSDEPDKSASSS